MPCPVESFYLDRPLNFAHRGASYEAPENTLAAFLLAAELGADGIEFDVQLSADGQAVVIHDFNLEKTTDGQGPVALKTLDELKELDAGAWFDPIFAGQRIPTLQEVIDAVGQRLLLNVELKTFSLRDDGLAAAVVRTIEDHHLLDRVIVSSFNPLAVRRVKQLNPRISSWLALCATHPLLVAQAVAAFPGPGRCLAPTPQHRERRARTVGKKAGPARQRLDRRRSGRDVAAHAPGRGPDYHQPARPAASGVAGRTGSVANTGPAIAGRPGS